VCGFTDNDESDGIKLLQDYSTPSPQLKSPYSPSSPGSGMLFTCQFHTYILKVFGRFSVVKGTVARNFRVFVAFTLSNLSESLTLEVL
jgi:hypothetical protein